jgi:probable rRNA maturation factor
MMHVHVSGRVPNRFSPSLVSETIEATFRRAKRSASGDVSVRFVSEQEIKTLNARYRGKKRATDVLSFSSQEVSSFPTGPRTEKEWGDLFVCPSYARKEALRRGIPFHEELVRLISHGALHLLGYDHATERDEHRMFGLQEEVVERVTQDL